MIRYTFTNGKVIPVDALSVPVSPQKIDVLPMTVLVFIGGQENE